MENQPEKTSPASDKPSFFGPPTAWAGFGRKFWGGVVMGLCIGAGLGLLFGAQLVEEGQISSENRGTLILVNFALLCIGIFGGRAIAGRPIRRNQPAK
jgi:hypothetical protein